MRKADHVSMSITSLLLARELAQVLDKHGVTARMRLFDQAGRPLDSAAQTALLGEIRVAQQKLEHLRRLSAVAALAAGVTHEIRNLLTGSLGFAQLLRSKAHDAASVQETARTIETELRRCVDVVASFLKLSRSGMEPTCELAISDVIDPVERLVAHSVRQRGCTLRVLSEGNVPLVLGRASDLQRLLINLVLNAADAAHVPGVHILLSAQRAPDGNVEIRVSDDGPGVPEAIAERIFEPFFSTKQAGDGTGLGLAISRSIAEAHGGKLSLDPTLAPGATFILRLPPAGFRLDGRSLVGTEGSAS